MRLRLGADDGRRPRGAFISYRRGDTDGQAHAVRDRLVKRFQARNVFMDVDSIVPGTDFVQRIEAALDSSGAMIVLIGRDWLREQGGKRRLDDPDDFVRLEVGAALQRKIPTIPVLINNTQLPASDELPEPLRALARMQAVTLGSASWDYDISRVTDAVASHIGHDRRRRLPRILIAAAIAIAIIATVVVLLTQRLLNPAPKPAALTATAAVAAVQPDRLARNLLDTPFAARDIPASASASAPRLADDLTSVTGTGLVVKVYANFAGPGNGIWINYYVFDNRGDATAYYTVSSPVMSGYHGAGQLADAGIGDPTKCQSSREAVHPQWAWSCLTLSGNVVSYSVVKNDADTGAGFDLALAADAVRHLRTVAGATPRGPLPSPPGSLQPGALLLQLQSPFPSALVPAGLSLPTVRYFKNSETPPGLLLGDRTSVTFSGSGTDGNSAQFFVFASAQEAQSWFSEGIGPLNSAGRLDKRIGNLIFPSGFPSSRQAQCGTYSQAAEGATPAQRITECIVLWGDVVVIGKNDTSKSASTANVNMALTLAWSGLLRIGQVITS